MKKFLTLALLAVLVLPFTASATADVCDQQFTYIKQVDFSDSRVVIDLASNKKTVSVSAPSGYEVLEVWLDVDSDGHSGQWNYANGPITNFNPNPGEEITIVKVVVRKTCTSLPPVDVCPNIEGNQAVVPEGYHLADGQCVVNTPPVVDLCPEEGVQTVLPCAVVTPPVEPPVTPPTPSPSPDLSDDSDHDGRPGGSHASGGLGGRHRCNGDGLPTCEEWVKGFTSPQGSLWAQLKAIQDLMAKILQAFNSLDK